MQLKLSEGSINLEVVFMECENADTLRKVLKLFEADLKFGVFLVCQMVTVVE